MKGTIKFFKPDKGFGFITGDDRQDYFFHQSELTMGLRPEGVVKGLIVRFEPQEHERGPRAILVQTI